MYKPFLKKKGLYTNILFIKKYYYYNLKIIF